MPVLILVRHGQSLWNAQNRFTGWEDIPLSPKGEEEAAKAGEILFLQKISFHCAWTSFLKRAQKTLQIILKEIKMPNLPTHSSWRLNERHYGKLQGLNKNEMKIQYGKDQVFQWRRSFTQSPPQISKTSPLHPSKNPLYRSIDPQLLPSGESLKETMARVLPLWDKEIEPLLKQNKNILIAAHGNSLRSLVKHIKKISDEEIPHFEIPTASPIKIEWMDPKKIHEPPKILKFLN